MDLNIVSKNNLGAVVALFLVIILSQAKFFNFLLNTALGRAVLIAIIIFISYANKILGVVSVLFIIIMFNDSVFGYMEAFTPNLSSTNTKMKKNDDINTASPVPVSATDSHHMEKEKEKEKTKTTAAEGHDIVGTEQTIKRGKQSNQIPATKTTGVENFAPFSGSYSDSYSSF